MSLIIKVTERCLRPYCYSWLSNAKLAKNKEQKVRKLE
jgi:hypothetical protein